jgi:hypothetical protein
LFLTNWVRIKLVNELQDIPGTGDLGNKSVYIANMTNLHLHGLHVSPEDENVLVDMIYPNGIFHTLFQI